MAALLAAAALLLLLLPGAALAQSAVRVATYNITFLRADVPQELAANIAAVIAALDADVNVYALAEAIEPGARLVIVLPASRLPLNNGRDSVTLLDAPGEIVHIVSYTAGQVRAGVRIGFP